MSKYLSKESVSVLVTFLGETESKEVIEEVEEDIEENEANTGENMFDDLADDVEMTDQ